jgi:hypothetical protein
MVKDFSFGEKAEAEDDELEVVEFTIDGKPFVMRVPSADTVMALSSAFGRNQKQHMLSATRTFIERHVLDGGADTLIDRWEDPDDPFGFEAILDIVKWAMEVSAENPSQPSSAPAPSPKRTGPRSTAAVPPKASTRVRSPRTASTT